MFQGVKKGATKGVWVVLAACFITLAASAAAAAVTISVSYSSSRPLPTGTIVAIDGQSDGAVIPADNEVNNNILGVVVAGSTVSVSTPGEGSQVEVGNRGTAYVLVSNINGAVGKGTPVTASPLEGIGMLASQDGKIVGIAQADLNDQALEAQYKTVQTKQGEDRRVLIGLVPVALDVTFYQQAPASSSVPKFLRDFSRAVSDKEVSPVRIWGSVAIVGAALLIAVVLLYGAVRGSIGAIGRNPLAKNTIQSSLLRVIALSVTVLVIATAAVYLILKG